LGALEAAVRLEALRYASARTDGPPSTSPWSPTVVANGEHVLTLGLTWYLNTWVKFQANEIRESFDEPAFSPMPARPAFWSTLFRLQFVM
jgi:hypothetical protein